MAFHQEMVGSLGRMVMYMMATLIMVNQMDMENLHFQEMMQLIETIMLDHLQMARGMGLES